MNSVLGSFEMAARSLLRQLLIRCQISLSLMMRRSKRGVYSHFLYSVLASSPKPLRQPFFSHNGTDAAKREREGERESERRKSLTNEMKTIQRNWWTFANKVVIIPIRVLLLGAGYGPIVFSNVSVVLVLMLILVIVVVDYGHCSLRWWSLTITSIYLVKAPKNWERESQSN